MPEASEPDADTIKLERVYNASIEDVWALWTTKDGFEEWFAPEGMLVEVWVLDLRVGGALNYVMTAVGAEQIAYLTNLNRPQAVRVSGRFVDIVHHRHLRIRFDIDFVPGVEPYPYDMMVELQAEAGHVRMVLTVDRHPDPEMTRGSVVALTSQLQRFDLAIAARAAQEQ